jgi:hypothetical protein
MNRFIVQRYNGRGPDGDEWADVAVLDAEDAGTALQRAMNDPTHKLAATTYRVAAEALAVNVSINLEPNYPVPVIDQSAAR